MTIKELFNHPIINLNKQIRYSNLKVMFPENVAEHSELVANIALIISIEIMKQFSDIKIDLKDIAYRGVIHDFGEAYTCDVTTDVKYSNPELPKILEEVESKGLSKDFSSKFINDINTAREGCIEGDIIMLADRLQALFKMVNEYMIQRTEIWKYSIINNSVPAVKSCILSLYSKYFNTNKIVEIFEDLLSGLTELLNILNSKVDFL